jgi:hypothetical protein
MSSIFNNLWGVRLCQSANKRDGNNVPKQETADGQRLQKRTCTDTKSDTKSRQTPSLSQRDTKSITERHQVYHRETPSLSQRDTKSTPKRKKQKKKTMENLMVVNWEEKRNKEGHKRATT